MTKYWVLTMIGAIGLAALLHPDRLLFLRSPAPWVAIATLVVAMLPHLVWLRQVDFVPLTYAGDVYWLTDRAHDRRLALGYVGHNFALLALPVALAALALACAAVRAGRRRSAPWSRGANAGVNLSQARNIWIIQAIVAIGPPLGALLFNVYMKTDWGISLFFLTPLALVAIPRAARPEDRAVSSDAIWLVITLVVLAASPYIAAHEMGEQRTVSADLWRALRTRARTDASLAHAVSFALGGGRGHTEIGEPLTFYSPDHPAPLTPDEPGRRV